MVCLRFVVGFVACVAAIACNRDKPNAVVDAGPPVARVDPPATVVAPEEPDAAIDAAVGPDASRTGGGLDTNQARALRCCRAIRDQARSLPTSVERAQIETLAGSCETLARGLGATPGKGSITELEPLRQMLKGKTIPPLCASL